MFDICCFFYLTLFLIALIKERRLLFRIVITCILTIIGYLPWFFVLLHTFQRTSDNYWMTSIPSFEECLCFLFYGKYQLILNIIFLSVTIFYLLRESGVAIINRVYNQLYPFKILIDFSAINITPEIIWVLSGYLSIFGTIGVGLGLSHIIRPMFIVRYIFPVATIAWVVMGICISKLPFKQYISLSLICIILIGGLQEYYWIYKADKNANELLTNTLNVISGQIQNEDQILTDVYHIDWTLVDVYYPGIKHQMLSASIYESLDENLMYWVILTEKMNNDIATSFAEENFMCECVVEEGNFGTLTVWVYKVYSGVNV